MRDGGGKSIGGIIWFWTSFEIQMELYHVLYLALFGRAVAGQSLFDLVWRVLKNWNIMLLSY